MGTISAFLTRHVSLWLIVAALAVPSAMGQSLKDSGDSARARGDFEQAEELYHAALARGKGNQEILLALAAVLGYQGHLDEAENRYDLLLKLNPASVDALCGKARIAWFGNRPFAAHTLYRKVLAVDPGNEEALSQIAKIRGLNGVHGALSAKLIEETENRTSYTATVLPLSELRISKRVTDLLELQAGVLLDKSQKRYRIADQGVDDLLESRFFGNVFMRTIFFHKKQTLFVHCGISPSDSLLSGFTVAYTPPLLNLAMMNITNTLEAGYDYFYYWSAAGKDFLSDNLRVTIKNWEVFLRLHGAQVRSQAVFHLGASAADTLWTIQKNTQFATREALQYKVPISTELRMFVAHEYSDYFHRSTLYYAPHRRNVESIGTDLAGKAGFFDYALNAEGGYDHGGIEADGSRSPADFFGSGSLELGLSWKQAKLSARGRLFQNPRYQATVYGLFLTW